MKKIVLGKCAKPCLIPRKLTRGCGTSPTRCRTSKGSHVFAEKNGRAGRSRVSRISAGVDQHSSIESLGELSRVLIDHGAPVIDLHLQQAHLAEAITRLKHVLHLDGPPSEIDHNLRHWLPFQDMHNAINADSLDQEALPNSETVGDAMGILDPGAVGGVADGLDAGQAAEVISRGLQEAGEIDPDAFNVLWASASALIEAMAWALGDSMQSATNRVYTDMGILIRHAAGGLGENSAGRLESLLALKDIALHVPEGSINGKMLTTLVIVGIAALAACLPVRGPGGEKSPEKWTLEWVTAKYDPERLAAYWATRPGAVLRRQSLIASKVMGFLTTLFLDVRTNKWDANIRRRSKEFREIVEDLGPAFVKVFQALSTRGDVFPEEWLEELAQLHDQVGPFSTDIALQQIEQGLGTEWYNMFEWLSEEPLASASLGQVYHGLLRESFGGGEVAVKVQRPDILERIALDCLLLRRGARIMTKVPNMSENWENLFDDWASRFFEELDYTREAHHCMVFRRHMEDMPDIVAPRVYHELTGRKVLTTEWIHGDKLSESPLVDGQTICRTLLNCYLIQLLEVGFLHADPHPGNLLCTSEGKLCFLDFGLVTEVTEDQKFALLEFITHLWMEDWSAVANDLRNLEFIPDNAMSTNEDELLDILHKIFGDMVNGGGLQIGKIVSELDTVARHHRLVIPPYFTLILRAFCIVEGIAKQTAGEFAIIQECLPYLSQRLLKDDNPRTHALLRSLLYTDDRLDIDRVRRLILATGKFTLGGGSPPADDGTGVGSFSTLEEQIKGRGMALWRMQMGTYEPVLDENVTEALKIVLSSRGSYAQQLLVDELATAVDNMSLSAIGEALRMLLGSLGSQLALQDAAVSRMTEPFFTVMQMVSSNFPRGPLTDMDEHALKNFKTILEMIESSQPRVPDAGSLGRRAVSAVGELVPLLPDVLPGLAALLVMLAKELLGRKAQWVADELGSGKSARTVANDNKRNL